MKPAPPVTRSRTARRLAVHLGEACAQTVAPVRQHGSSHSLAPQHGVRRSRRRTLELGGRDPADTAARAPPPRRSPRRSRPTCSHPRPRRARAPSAGPRRRIRRTAAARWPTNVGQPRWSSTTATSSRSAPSRSIVRRKLWPVGPKSHDVRIDPRVRPGGGLAVELRPAVGGRRVRAVRLDVGRALPPVEDVVGREGHERRLERCCVCGSADVHGRRTLRVVLGPVDVGPRRRVQHEVQLASRR